MRIAASITLVATFMVTGSALAGQATFVEDFSDGENEGNWSYFGDPNNTIEVLEEEGGNPDQFIHSTCEGTACLDTFAPKLRTEWQVESEFTGNYQEMNVTSVGIDLILFYVDTVGARELTLRLRSDNGTPDDDSDDLTVYKLGTEFTPFAGAGWSQYTVSVPSQSETLPEGWTAQGSGTDDEIWNTVITDVDQVEFFYGDPQLFYIFQQWEPGFDNPRITKEGDITTGDINEDGTVGVNDLLILLADWGKCDDCAADLDGNGVVDVNDLLMLLANWT